jgi:hypothetical protein
MQRPQPPQLLFPGFSDTSRAGNTIELVPAGRTEGSATWDGLNKSCHKESGEATSAYRIRAPRLRRKSENRRGYLAALLLFSNFGADEVTLGANRPRP